MPFLGARSRSGKFQINAKVYGPDSDFDLGTRTLLVDSLKDFNDKDISLIENPAGFIAHRLAALLKTDQNATWVECEVLREDGISVGDVAVIRES